MLLKNVGICCVDDLLVLYLVNRVCVNEFDLVVFINVLLVNILMLFGKLFWFCSSVCMLWFLVIMGFFVCCKIDFM